MGLPVTAFMMAVAFAFATETNSSQKEELITGYINQGGSCVTAPKDCNQQSIMPCLYNDVQVFRDFGSTTCAVPLTHNGL